LEIPENSQKSPGNAAQKKKGIFCQVINLNFR